MTAVSLPDRAPANRRSLGKTPAPLAGSKQQIPGAFQFLLGLYIVLTGTFPVIIQAMAFGVQGGGVSEFAAAMTTQTAFELLLLLPVLMLSNHPLGILHPVVLTIVAWPLLRDVPNVIQDLGGWAGLLSASPVKTPYFFDLPDRSPSTVWTAIAKFNALQVLGLVCAYAGFWIFKGKQDPVRRAASNVSPESVRLAMMGLILFALVIFLYFIRERGGVGDHLTSIGKGRFKELSAFGTTIVAINLGSIALYLWIAAKPSDIKSPMFLAATAVVTASQFISGGARSGAIEVPMLVGLIWALRTRKIPWKTALLLLPVMFISIGLLGAIRTASWSGSTATKVYQTTTWSESLVLAEEEVLSRNANSSNVPVVQRGFTVSGGPLLGASYIPVVSAFIPRPLWPDKPRGVGSLYVQLFEGSSLSGSSIPVSPEVEMYWNFGLAGVVILSIFYGMLLRVAYNSFWSRYPNPFAIVFFVIFITRFQFSSDRIVVLEQRLFLLFFCYVMVMMFVPKMAPMQNSRLQPAAGARRSAGSEFF